MIIYIRNHFYNRTIFEAVESKKNKRLEADRTSTNPSHADLVNIFQLKNPGPFRLQFVGRDTRNRND